MPTSIIYDCSKREGVFGVGEIIVGILLILFAVWLYNRNVNFTLFYLIPIPSWLVCGPFLLFGIGMVISGIRF